MSEGWREERERGMPRDRRGKAEKKERGSADLVGGGRTDKEVDIRKVKGRQHEKGQYVRGIKGRGEGEKRITDSKGEKVSVSELCLHSSGGEMKMISPARVVDVHFYQRKKSEK